MSGISAIYFLDQKGKPIIFRNYRGEVNQNISENFQRKVLELEEVNMKPIFCVDTVHYIWIKHRNIYIVAVSKRNPNAALVISLLYKIVEILIAYFSSLEDESIRDNFVLIYELLDELIDHGYPQTTDTKLLKEFIKTEGYKLKRSKEKKEKLNAIEITKTLANNISWRKEGIKHKTNQAFLDVVEKVNCLVNKKRVILQISNKGVVLRSEISGAINMNCELTGMPNLKLGLNDKAFFELSGRTTRSRTIEMDDIRFHECVDKAKFFSDRVIEFIPPDGRFELATYRLNTQLKPLIWVEVSKEPITPTKIEYIIKAKSNYRNRSIAHNVEILIPVPNDLKNPIFKTYQGIVHYLPDQDSIIWHIKDLAGQVEVSMKFQFTVPTVRSGNWEKNLTKPISVKFEIPSFTVSGIQVRYLKIQEKSGYSASPYVKYMTMNGDYHIRLV